MQLLSIPLWQLCVDALVHRLIWNFNIISSAIDEHTYAKSADEQNVEDVVKSCDKRLRDKSASFIKTKRKKKEKKKMSKLSIKKSAFYTPLWLL